ncbi:MAG: hypothetical protein ABR513_09295 [Desulfotignum sp.]
MYTPFQYQTSEYDCVPTALVNAVSCLFTRKEVPPMVIRHIYLYCMDTVGRNARFGIGGTSKYAVRLVGNWLESYKFKTFSVRTVFLEKEAVRLDSDESIRTCLDEGGVVLCNILLTQKEEHYIMITKIEDDWVYAFDSYFRTSIRGMKGYVSIPKSVDGRSPNLKIRLSWLDQPDCRRFCLGPLAQREALLMWRLT